MAGPITERSGALDAGTLRDRLRTAKAEQASTINELALPGYSGQLVARYRTLEWRERRRIGMGVKGPDIPARELEAAADILLASCEGVDAHVDGQVVALEHKLGMGLASYLGEEGAETDRQAMFLIFPSDLALMSHLEELAKLQAGEDDLVGE